MSNGSSAKLLVLAALFLRLSMASPPALAAADLVVIANPSSGLDKLSRPEVSAIFLGRTKRLPSGMPVLPIDLNTGGEKARFYKELVNKDLPELTSHWARIIFSGQGSPPRQIDSVEEVIDTVSNNRGALGYIPPNAADKRVRVIFDMASP